MKNIKFNDLLSYISVRAILSLFVCTAMLYGIAFFSANTSSPDDPFVSQLAFLFKNATYLYLLSISLYIFMPLALMLIEKTIVYSAFLAVKQLITHFFSCLFVLWAIGEHGDKVKLWVMSNQQESALYTLCFLLMVTAFFIASLITNHSIFNGHTTVYYCTGNTNSSSVKTKEKSQSQHSPEKSTPVT